ncbi:MAG: SH3 domain-containing protein [Caldilineaceae bacterium]|nr:SH3 domain-containing protein [Caldilineaceae bacterium]
MNYNYPTSVGAILLMAALLLTACVPLPADPGIPISGPAPETPLISIHNPLVVPVGDTPSSSGGPFQDWPAFEVESHRIRVFHPNRWLFVSTQEELSALGSQIGDDELAEAFFEEREGYVGFLTQPGQEDYFAGAGFPYDPDSPPLETNGFHLLAVPSEGRTLETFARLLSDELGASGLAEVDGIEIGPGLRPWGEETATIQYRIDGTQAFGNRIVTVPDANVVGWRVIMLSPDGGTFLTVTYDVWGEYSEWVEGLLREVVRRVQWVDDPSHLPRPGPTVTLEHLMNVRAGPGTDYPILGKAGEGQQFAAISRDAVGGPAGGWWQIEYRGQLGWLHGDYVSAPTAAEDIPHADESGWLTYEDVERGLSLSLPAEWRYFDPAWPTAADLALLSAANKVSEEQFDVLGLSEIVSAMSLRRDDAVIGLGLQSGQDESEASNFMLVFSFAASGQNLAGYAQAASEQTYSIEPAVVELVRGMRPSDEEVVSIKYGEYATNNVVWQIWLLSPNGERLVALGFNVHRDQIEELEPVIAEVVQRLRWIDN